MVFSEVINLLKKYFSYIDFENYDGLIIKKLSATNTINETGDSHQSHIAITGKQMDFFPFLSADGYFNVPYKNKEDDLKKFFTLQIPINIYKRNYEYLKRESNAEITFSENTKKTYASVIRSRRESDGDQIEFSIKSLDGVDFLEYRKLYTIGDFFILLKRKNILEYDLLGLKKDIEDATELSKLNDFYRVNKSVTKVSSDLFDQKTDVIVSKEINYPHNRIIFGAPGTGKSFQINKDAKDFGDNYERVTFHPNYSYAQFVGTYKPVMKTSMTHNFNENEKYVMEVLTDKTKTAQEKYNLLYDKFKAGDLTRLPILIGLYSDEDFKTLKQDGTPAANDNSVERNHGKAIRPYVNLISETSNTSEISYSYVPGPFIRVLEKALYSQQIGTNEPYLLIIEEINRANVAAVFGDVFQLLDRNELNESQYEIDVSEDLYNYLTSEDNEQTGHKKLNIGKKLKIPSNMYIWATMNSADQGVLPMDAAFKRRWDFEYLGIDDAEKNDDGSENTEFKSYVLPIPHKDSDGNISYTSENWNKIRHAINDKLKNIYGVNEDKLLGPYFLSKSTLDEAKEIKYEVKKEETIPIATDINKAEKICSLFKSKVLMYLYEDVVKMNPSELFNKSVFSEDKPLHYSDLCNKFDELGLKIFDEDFVK